MAAANRPRVFLDIAIGTQPAGRLTIELFADKTPRACENFRQLCTGKNSEGLSYERVPFHRIIDEFMIQGGDVEKQDGTGTKSIYGREFEDEELEWREMDAKGLVCCANRGKDTNGSQFFITLDAAPHLNGKHTIFGRVVGGEEVLERMAKVKVDGDDRPLEPVVVERCGELEKRKKEKRDSKQHQHEDVKVGERGRRGRSDQDKDDDAMDTTSPENREKEKRRRRQSDNVVDEGIRGRPRLRSHSRSPSHPIEEDDGDVSDDSPAKMHKRKRSPSPSRHVDRRSEQAGEERRRRSLPNQYNEDRRRGYGDDDRYRPSPRRDDYRHHGHRRDDNRYRPSRDRYGDEGRLGDDGRLGGSGGGDFDPPVKFKGRGVMKYREPDRAW